jgi:hypothetical protein
VASHTGIKNYIALCIKSYIFNGNQTDADVDRFIYNTPSLSSSHHADGTKEAKWGQKCSYIVA